MTLSQFRSAAVGELRGELITVDGLVKYFAHVHGGVHAGRADTDLEKFFRQALVSTPPLRNMMLAQLQHIGQVVVDAVTPAADAVTADPVTWAARDGDHSVALSLFDERA